MPDVSVICTVCKRLVPVVDRQIANHNASGGGLCGMSGQRYVPQGFHSRKVPLDEWGLPGGGGHWEQATPGNMPDPSQLRLVASSPIYGDSEGTTRVGHAVLLRDADNHPVLAVASVTTTGATPAPTDGAPAKFRD